MILALSSGWALVKVGLLLAAILGVLVFANQRARGRSQAGAGERLPLTAQHSLHVVDIEGRRLLIGAGPTGAPRLLCDLDDPASPAESAPDLEPPPPRVGWDGR